MTGITCENVADRLNERVPEFKDIYDAHVAFYGEAVNHVLFGELLHFTVRVARALAGSTGDFDAPADILKRSLAFVEEIARSKRDSVSELAYVSFIEGLGETGQGYNLIRSHLGPASRKAFKAIFDCAPDEFSVKNAA